MTEWDVAPQPPEMRRPAGLPDGVSITSLADITPLDHQFAAAAPKTVPDALHAEIFGQDPGTPRHTYALFDASRQTNFLETLDGSGLER